MLNDSELIISRGQLEVIGEFSSTGHYLVIDQSTERIGLLKILNYANPRVYHFLMHNPHRNLCSVYDYWTEDDRTFVFEEYLSGRTLEERFIEGGFSEAEAVDILCQICDGLNVLHNANPVIIHKDLKFVNVMIDSCGCVKIIDFDIARTYRIGADQDTKSFGTPPYASPEHFGFGQTNEKSDQYAIGQMMKKMGLEYGRFSSIIMKATQIDPNNRYRNVMELKYDIMGKSKTLLPVPGFRTGVIWKEIIAILGYLLIICLSLSMNVKEPKGMVYVWGNRAFVFCMLLTEVDLFSKWTFLFRRVSILYDSRIVVRTMAHIAVSILVMFIWAIIETIVLYPFK